MFITGDDPSNHPELAKLPPHLREHERDPLSLNPEVFFNDCSFFFYTMLSCYPVIIFGTSPYVWRKQLSSEVEITTVDSFFFSLVLTCNLMIQMNFCYNFFLAINCLKNKSRILKFVRDNFCNFLHIWNPLVIYIKKYSMHIYIRYKWTRLQNYVLCGNMLVILNKKCLFLSNV